MRKLLDGIERALDVVGAALVALCLLAVAVQVVMRYGFGQATLWSDTVAAAALSWLAFLAATAAVRRDHNLAVRFVLARMGPGTLKLAQTFGLIASLCFALMLAFSGTELMTLTRTTHVEGLVLDVSWAEVYSVSVVSGALMAVFAVEQIAVLWLRGPR
jgi:TRAP-type C4-dicarboxylate transport system permease small subunit